MEIGTQNGIRKLKLPINHSSAPSFKDHKMPKVMSLTWWGGRRGPTEKQKVWILVPFGRLPSCMIWDRHSVTYLDLIFLLCTPESVARASPPHRPRSGALAGNRLTSKFQNGNSPFTSTAVSGDPLWYY